MTNSNSPLNLGNVQGLDGKDGRGIASINKTSTELSDVYTITYSDGETYEFTITNGKDGQKGEDGKDGRGIKEIRKHTIGNVDTYTIAYTDDSEPYTFTITNGVDGLSAYEIYKIHNPSYTKTEAEWVADLANGDLTTIRYTVTFNTAGGSEVESQTDIRFGGKATKPQNPAKEGYIFAGWYCEGELWNFMGYSVTENITLTAKWISLDYKIILNSNGGNETYDNITIKYGEAYNLPQPTREGYSFVGWFSGNVEYDEGMYNYDYNLVLAAKWEALSYSVNYYIGEELVATDIAYFNANYTFKSDVLVDNQQVVSWTYNGTEYMSGSVIAYNFVNDISVQARLEQVEDISDYTYYITGNEVELSDYTGSDTDIIIPKYVNINDKYYKVTKLGEIIFQSSNIESVYIPNTITSIESHAFYLCKNLTSVTFEYNSQLISIGEMAFGATGIMTFNLPDSVTTIEYRAFYNCSDLYDFKVGQQSKLKTIDSQVFSNCGSLINVSLPKTLTEIKTNGFYGCSNLINVYYNGTAGDWCKIKFRDVYATPMYHAINLYILDDNGNKSYNNLKYSILTEMVVPDSVVSIDYQLRGLKQLQSITLSNNVIKIGEYAFENCERLTTITIPNSVSQLGINAFYNCVSLKQVTFEDDCQIVKLQRTFSNCSSLTSVDFGKNSSISIIDEYTFNSASLVDLHLPENIVMIKQHAFYNCNNLQSLILPSTISVIQDGAFSYCDKLEKVYYEGSVEDWEFVSVNV